MIITRTPIVVAIALTVGFLSVSHASPPAPADRCAALKLDATARALIAELGCHARAATSGTTVRPRCIEDVEGALAAAFGRAEEHGGCAFAGDRAAVDAMIDGTIDDLITMLAPTPAFKRCAIAKLHAAARLAARGLACERRAVRNGQSVDAGCLADAAERFTPAFANAERRSTCGATGDAAAIEVVVAAFTSSAAARIRSGVVPNGVPSGLGATVSGSAVELAWTAPDALSESTHVRVLRRLDTPPVDASDPAATIVFFGTATTADDPLTALLPSTPETARVYHYAAFGCTAAGACESTGSRTTLAPTVVQVLRAGGYVLHWRHAAATVCADRLDLGTAAGTSSPNWWKSCDAQCPASGGMATARQLDATGVTQAASIGQAFDARAIPIGRVLSSEFCRNVTTATLMDFGPVTEQRPDITFFVYDEAGRCNASYALLAETPAAGTNTAVIGHAGFTCDVLGSLEWGEAAIFKPDGAGGSAFVTRVLSNGWTALP